MALYEYDTFLDSLRTITDMGCGTGEDITWWAMLETRDDPPVPHNYRCIAVDNDPYKLSKVPDLENISKIQADFNESIVLPVKTDLMFAHDVLQYSTNPLQTLRWWNSQMNVNGMLVLAVPQHSGVQDNRYYSKTHNHCFFHYTPSNLIYMLAVNGFDCRDAYLKKELNDPWINMAVYKTDIEPMDPRTTTWSDLIDKKLLHPSVEASILKHGYLQQEEILYPWLDRENYFIDYIQPYTEIPKEAGEPTITGVFNQTVAAETKILEQAPATVKDTGELRAAYSTNTVKTPTVPLQPPKKDFTQD